MHCFVDVARFLRSAEGLNCDSINRRMVVCLKRGSCEMWILFAFRCTVNRLQLICKHMTRLSDGGEKKRKACRISNLNRSESQDLREETKKHKEKKRMKTL